MNSQQRHKEVLLLMPCCGRKKGTGPRPQIASAPLKDELSPTSMVLLNEGRQLAFSVKPSAINLSSPLLPAVTWYTGMPYSVDGFRQNLDVALTLGVKCLIVSAGYGLLRPDDPIHKYNVTMQETLGIWRRRLPEILADYVLRNGIKRVFGVLSTKYYEAVAQLEGLMPDVAVRWLVPAIESTDSGAALRVVPEKVAHGVVELIRNGFAPDPAWNGDWDRRTDFGRERSTEGTPELHWDTSSKRAGSNSSPSASRAGGTLPNAADFRTQLDLLLEQADTAGQTSFVLRASDLHRQVGGYPGPNHRMANCCQVMLGRMQTDDEIVDKPPKGKGPSLTIRYRLPRKQAR